MNKRALIQKIISQLASDLEAYHRAARAAHAEATHEQSRAENKYDTRGLEASYLARGQSRQAAELEAAIAAFEKLDARAFAPADPIDLGALVELESPDGRDLYFLGPKAGGTEVTHQKRDVLVITPPSPLGEQILGRRQGDVLELNLGGRRNKYRIASVG